MRHETLRGQHLEDILKDEVRPISNALQQHGRSRSVNLHVAETGFWALKPRSNPCCGP